MKAQNIHKSTYSRYYSLYRCQTNVADQKEHEVFLNPRKRNPPHGRAPPEDEPPSSDRNEETETEPQMTPWEKKVADKLFNKENEDVSSAPSPTRSVEASSSAGYPSSNDTDSDDDDVVYDIAESSENEGDDNNVNDASFNDSINELSEAFIENNYAENKADSYAKLVFSKLAEKGCYLVQESASKGGHKKDVQRMWGTN